MMAWARVPRLCMQKLDAGAAKDPQRVGWGQRHGCAHSCIRIPVTDAADGQSGRTRRVLSVETSIAIGCLMEYPRYPIYCRQPPDGTKTEGP